MFMGLVGLISIHVSLLRSATIENELLRVQKLVRIPLSNAASDRNKLYQY